MHRVLLIEDSADLARNIVEFLESDYEVDLAVDGETGLRSALRGEYGLIVLDLTLPRLDGLEVCARVRSELGMDPPILMLTARDTLDDKIRGFDAGADDYLVKPFALRELEARVAALLRRHAGSDPEPDALTVADLDLDVGTCEVRRGGHAIRLNKIGLRILEVLMRASPNVVRREDLEARVWEGHRISESVVRTHLWSLRRAIDGEDPESKLIHTVHGIGYRLAAQADDR